MSSRHANQSVEILYSRYSDCLRNVEISAILPHLIEKDLITPSDREAIMKHTTLLNQRRRLCRVLAQLGSGKLVATTTAIQDFRQKLDEKPQTVGNDGLESRGIVISPVDGGNERHLHIARHMGERVQNGGSNGHDVAAIANKKHQMKDESDSPLREEAHCQQRMEAFVVLFFTFIYQILHGTHKRPEGRLPWLDTDTSLEQVREYFPAEAIKGVHPSGSVQLHSSVLLEAFSQFYQKLDRLTRENKSLTSTARLVQAVTKRSTALEEELSHYRGKMHCRPSTEPRDHSGTVQGLQRQVDQLESNVRELTKQIEPLKRALAKSEDRNKQLVDVTQQWAIECQEKDNQIAVRDSQIRELRAEVDQMKQQLLNVKKHNKELLTDREQFKKKISKLKKQLNSSSEGTRGDRVSDSQFEELRVELAYRRELYDQVLIQKEIAEDQVRRLTEQNGVLTHQLEENKEITEELRDRLGNFKVQAQAKEPSVKEMSHLLQENRLLTEENSQLQQRITVLEDETLAFRTHMEELAQAAQHHQQVQRGPQSPRRVDCPQPLPRQPAKTQAMVTGYRTAGRRQASHSNEELHRRQGHAQNGTSTSTTGEPQLAVATVSARSSRPKSAPSHSRSPSPPSIEKLPELREQESSSTATHIASVDASSQSATTERHLTNGYTRSTDTTGSRDYTREICYPARSGILVQPLQDDDWEILQSLNDTSQSQLPVYYDHMPLQPTKPSVEKDPISPSYSTPTESPAATREDEQLFSFSKNERKCPVCQRMFLSLGECEFRSHIAGCFT